MGGGEGLLFESHTHSIARICQNAFVCINFFFLINITFEENRGDRGERERFKKYTRTNFVDIIKYYKYKFFIF